MPYKEQNYNLQLEIQLLTKTFLILLSDIEKMNEKTDQLHNEKGLNFEHFMKRDFKQSYTNQAIFTYAHSLFERFLTHMLKHEIRSNNDIKKRYLERWSTLFEKGEHKKYGFSVVDMRDDNKLIEGLNVLLSVESKTTVEFIISLFGIKKPRKGSETFFRMCEYVISREIRNTITHRGNLYDDVFFTALKRNKYLQDDPQELNEYLYVSMHEFQQLDFSEDKCKKSFNESAMASLINSPLVFHCYEDIPTLIFLSSWLALETHHLDKNRIKSGDPSLICYCFNMLNQYAHKTSDSTFIYTALDLYRILKNNHYKNNTELLSDIDKFNIIQSLDLYLRSLRPQEDKTSESDFSERKQLKQIEKSIKKEIEKLLDFKELGTRYKSLLKASITNDVSKLCKILKSMQLTKQQLNEWAVFDKFRDEKKFQTILASSPEGEREFSEWFFLFDSSV